MLFRSDCVFFIGWSGTPLDLRRALIYAFQEAYYEGEVLESTRSNVNRLMLLYGSQIGGWKRTVQAQGLWASIEDNIRSGSTWGGMVVSHRYDGVYIGLAVNGSQDGYGTKLYSTGDVFTGEWQGNEPNGRGSFLWEDGSSYFGYWRCGLRNGYGSFTGAHGDEIKGYWLKGHIVERSDDEGARVSELKELLGESMGLVLWAEEMMQKDRHATLTPLIEETIQQIKEAAYVSDKPSIQELTSNLRGYVQEFVAYLQPIVLAAHLRQQREHASTTWNQVMIARDHVIRELPTIASRLTQVQSDKLSVAMKTLDTAAYLGDLATAKSASAELDMVFQALTREVAAFEVSMESARIKLRQAIDDLREYADSFDKWLNPALRDKIKERITSTITLLQGNDINAFRVAEQEMRELEEAVDKCIRARAHEYSREDAHKQDVKARPYVKNLAWVGLAALCVFLVVSYIQTLEFRSELTMAEAVRMVGPSVAYVEVRNRAGDPVASGTGFAVDRQGTIVTNHHVIEGGYAVWVELPNGRSYQAKVTKIDKGHDIALLQISGPTVPVAIGNLATLRNGQSVAYIGHPGDDRNVISGAKIHETSSLVDGQHYIEVDTVAQPGNSGGPLLTLHGEVMGMITLTVKDNYGRISTMAVSMKDIRRSMGK